MEPARTSVEGEYPKQENEIMVTEKALEECGYGNLDIGDTFRMTVGTPKGSFEKEFRIPENGAATVRKRYFMSPKVFMKRPATRFRMLPPAGFIWISGRS